MFIKNREVHRGTAGDGERVIHSRWSSLRRLTLQRLIPARRARSREELRATESEARPLPIPRGGRSRPFLPHYESTGSSCLRPQTAELWKKGLNQSAPSVFSPAPCNGKRRKTARRSLHAVTRHLFIFSSRHSLSNYDIQSEEGLIQQGLYSSEPLPGVTLM